jgi:DNA-binding transcriptional LysR family regulator
MDIELRHLRAFDAVAASLSFTAASRELLITQPALTRTIQQLERTLQVRLLDRTSRTVELTDAGRRFLTSVQTILGELDLATATARGERELRIGFQWALPDPWIAETIATFEQATGASATLLRRDDIVTALRVGDIDLALVRTDLDAPDIAVAALFDEPRVAAVSRRSPLSARAKLSWQELGTYPLVINTVSGNTRPEMWPVDQRPDTVIECGNYDEWIALVAAGRGVGATPASAARTHAHTGVVFLPLEDAPVVTLRVAWLPRRGSPLVRRFAEIAHTPPSPDGAGTALEGRTGAE